MRSAESGPELVPGGDMKKALRTGIGSILLRKPTLCLVAPLGYRAVSTWESF